MGVDGRRTRSRVRARCSASSPAASTRTRCCSRSGPHCSYASRAASGAALTMRWRGPDGAIAARDADGKVNFYGLVPGALLAAHARRARDAGGRPQARAARRGDRRDRRSAPFLLEDRARRLGVEPHVRARAHAGGSPEDHGGLGSQLSYLWQVFLPRLPGQPHTAFPEFYPGCAAVVQGLRRRVRLDGGRLPGVGVRLAPRCCCGPSSRWRAHAAGASRASCGRAAGSCSATRAMAGGLLLLIGLVALRGFAPRHPGAVQGRYLLPLLRAVRGTARARARAAPGSAGAGRSASRSCSWRRLEPVRPAR